MILSFKKFDNLLLYLSLKVGVNFMNSQHLRLKWHFEKLDKYGPRAFKEVVLQELNRTDVKICHELVHSVPRIVRAKEHRLDSRCTFIDSIRDATVSHCVNGTF